MLQKILFCNSGNNVLVKCYFNRGIFSYFFYPLTWEMGFPSISSVQCNPPHFPQTSHCKHDRLLTVVLGLDVKKWKYSVTRIFELFASDKLVRSQWFQKTYFYCLTSGIQWELSFRRRGWIILGTDCSKAFNLDRRSTLS